MIYVKYQMHRMLTEDGEMKRVYDTLSAYRQKKVDDCSLQQRKMETLAAGRLLELLLAEAGETPPFAYGVSRRGKPYLLDGCKNRREDLAFSLSHTRQMSVCGLIVSHDVEDWAKKHGIDRAGEPFRGGPVSIGVDVEALGRYRPRVVEHYFTPQEQAFFITHSKREENPLRQEMFTLLWTGKEAIAKCLDLPLQQVCGTINLSEICIKVLEKGEGLTNKKACRFPLLLPKEDAKAGGAEEESLRTLQLAYCQTKGHILSCVTTGDEDMDFIENVKL